MKILQLNPAFYPAFAYGGTVNVSYNLSKALAKRGHDVTVYTSDTMDKRTRKRDLYLEHEGMKIHYFRNISNLLAWHRYLLYPGLVGALRNHIQEFDIIHLHGSRNFQNVVAAHYARKYDVPYILQAHGSVPIFQKQQLKRLFDSIFGYKILKDASRVIALTKTEAEQYIKMGVDKDKIEIVPNGVDLSKYEILPEKGEFKKKYGLKNDEKIILYAGRLHATKGVDLLIEAFADISSNLDNIRLVLLGPDDGFRSSLDSIMQKLDLNNKVIFTGFVSIYEKKMAFTDANVFVTPMFSGFPITFLESCACGTPIVTTNNGDKLDWINNNVGYVVGYDKDELRDAIIYILKNENIKKRFGEEGKKLIKEEFNWEKIVEHMEDIYEKCVSKNRN